MIYLGYDGVLRCLQTFSLSFSHRKSQCSEEWWLFPLEGKDTQLSLKSTTKCSSMNIVLTRKWQDNCLDFNHCSSISYIFPCFSMQTDPASVPLLAWQFVAVQKAINPVLAFCRGDTIHFLLVCLSNTVLKVLNEILT